MSELPTTTYDFEQLHFALILGALMFTLGAVGFVTRRNLAVVIVSAGIMLQGVVVTLVAFSGFHGTSGGYVFALVVVAITATETIVGASFLIALSRNRPGVDVSRWTRLGDAECGPVERTDKSGDTARAESGNDLPIHKSPPSAGGRHE